MGRMKQQFFETKKCELKTVEKLYTTQTAECKDVTKHNCVTKWEVVNGQKVWTENEDCEEIVVPHCELVDVEKKFNKTESVCIKDDLVPYMDCEPTNKIQKTSRMTCTPKSTVECNPTTKNLCTTVKWTESKQEKDEKCWFDKIYKPTQEVHHKKECICPDPTKSCHPPTNLTKNSKPKVWRQNLS